MGTEVRVYLWHEDEADGRRLTEAVFDEAVRIDELMSTYKESSQISEVNRNAATAAVIAGAELASLIQRALDISVLTRGAFDITYESVGQHYDFRERRRPSDDTVAAERVLIDYRLVEVDRVSSSVRFLKQGVRINLGGSVIAGAELASLIQRALDISVLTRGAFDITYESVGQHYDFRERRRPSDDTVAAERVLIDYRLVEVDRVSSSVRFLYRYSSTN